MEKFTKTDLEMCKDSIVYLLSLSCKGKFCKDCKYSMKNLGTCLKGDLRDIIEVKHPISTELQTLTDVYDVIESVRQLTIDNCNLSGVWCKNGCPFMGKTDARCKRIQIREELKKV